MAPAILAGAVAGIVAVNANVFAVRLAPHALVSNTDKVPVVKPELTVATIWVVPWPDTRLMPEGSVHL